MTNMTIILHYSENLIFLTICLWNIASYSVILSKLKLPKIFSSQVLWSPILLAVLILISQKKGAVLTIVRIQNSEDFWSICITAGCSPAFCAIWDRFFSSQEQQDLITNSSREKKKNLLLLLKKLSFWNNLDGLSSYINMPKRPFSEKQANFTRKMKTLKLTKF